MARIFRCICFFLLVPSFLFSQVRIGLQLSPSIGGERKVNEETKGDYIIRRAPGLSLGFVVQQTLSERWFIETGAVYAYKGSGFKFLPLQTNSYTLDGRIEVPFIASYRQRINQSLQLKYSLGAAVDFFGIDGSFQMMATSPDSSSSLTTTVDSYGNNNFYGLINIGVEKIFHNGKTIFFGFGYHQGIRTIGYTRAIYLTPESRYTYESLYKGSHMTICFKYYFGKDIEILKRTAQEGQ